MTVYIADKLNNTVSEPTPVLHKSTPTSINSILNPSNYYDVLGELADDDDDRTIVMSNLLGTDKSNVQLQQLIHLLMMISPVMKQPTLSTNLDKLRLQESLLS